MYNLRLTHKEIEMKRIPEAGQKLQEFVLENSVNDYVLLETCNRAELYCNGIGITPLDGFVFESGERAFRHLLRVACGLESFVIGETEILSQLRDAYQLAKQEGHCSSELGAYLEAAIRIGRRVRYLTGISRGKVSIVSLALDYVQDLLDGLGGKRVLVIGAGDIGSKVARALKCKNVEKILVANRRYERAVELAREIGAKAYSLSHLDELLSRVDIVICATSAPHLIVTKERVKAADRKLVVVDLSVPRNVDEAIRDLGNVKLITFEDLASKANENLRERAHEVVKVERMIERELKKSRSDLDDLFRYAEIVRRSEVEKALRLLARRPPEEIIEDLSKVLVRKLYYPLRGIEDGDFQA